MLTWALARTQSGTLVVTPLRSLHTGSIPLKLLSSHETLSDAWAALQERKHPAKERAS